MCCNLYLYSRMYIYIIYEDYNSNTTTKKIIYIFLTLTWERATVLGGPPAVLARVCWNIKFESDYN